HLKRLQAQLESWRHSSDGRETLEAPVLRFETCLGSRVTAQRTTLILESRVDALYRDEDAGMCLFPFDARHFGPFNPQGNGPWKKLGKPHRLYSGYLRWLLVNACLEMPCRWTAIFEDRRLEFPALERAEARRRLDDWLAVWWRAWQE